MVSAFLGKTDASSPAHLMLAEIALQARNSTAAIAQYCKVLEKDSRNLVALNGLACLLADQANRPDEALKYAQQAKELAPHDPAADDTLGWIYYRKEINRVAAGHLEASGSERAERAAEVRLGHGLLQIG